MYAARLDVMFERCLHSFVKSDVTVPVVRRSHRGNRTGLFVNLESIHYTLELLLVATEPTRNRAMWNATGNRFEAWNQHVPAGVSVTGKGYMETRTCMLLWLS